MEYTKKKKLIKSTDKLHFLKSEAKIVKQEIKEDNYTEIDEQKYCRNNKFKSIS